MHAQRTGSSETRGENKHHFRAVLLRRLRRVRRNALGQRCGRAEGSQGAWRRGKRPRHPLIGPRHATLSRPVPVKTRFVRQQIQTLDTSTTITKKPRLAKKHCFFGVQRIPVTAIFLRVRPCIGGVPGFYATVPTRISPHIRVGYVCRLDW